MPFVDAACATRAYFYPLLASLPSCSFPHLPSSSLDLPLSFGHLLFSLRLSSVTQLTPTNRSPFIPRLSPVHHTQPDASCEAETSFLSCFAFDDSELTCSTTTSRPCFFPFDSLRALAPYTAFFSLHPTSFTSLLLNISSYRTSFFFLLHYLDVFLIFFGLICNFILKCVASREC